MSFQTSQSIQMMTHVAGLSFLVLSLAGCGKDNSAKRLQSENQTSEGKPTTPEEPSPSGTVYRGKATSHWIWLLNDSRVDVRCSAVKALVVIGAKEKGVPEAIVRAIGDNSDTVKQLVAVAVLSFGETVKPALAEANNRFEAEQRLKYADLKDLPDSPNPKKAPIEFLGPLEFLVGLDPWFAGVIWPATLLAIGHDTDNDFRIAVMKSLSIFEPPPDDKSKRFEELVAVLRSLLNDSDEKVRGAAADSLRRFGVKENP